MTLLTAISKGEELLRNRGIAEPRWNAERLLLLALKTDRASVYADLNRQLGAEEQVAFDRLLVRRSDHYPLAYLEGTQEFYGRTFKVEPGVLIPRPETEEIIRAVLSLPLPSNPRVVDFGAGSGCIPATLAMENPAAKVFALEYSRDALPCLRANAGNVEMIQGNFLASPFLPESFDIVTCNPPYVEKHDFDNLPAETKWEPHSALITISLETTYTALLQEASRVLKPGGYFIFEIGFGQLERIEALIKEFETIEVRSDYREVPRCFVLRKKSK